MYNYLICLLVLYPRKYFVSVFCFFHKQIHQRPIISLIFTWFTSITFYEWWEFNLFNFKITKFKNSLVILFKLLSWMSLIFIVSWIYFFIFLFLIFFVKAVLIWIFLSINCIKLIVPMVSHMKTNKITHGNQKCTFKTIYAKIFVFVYKRCN